MFAATEPLHLVIQDDPTFSTARRCCSECARLCWTGRPGSARRWTHDPSAWSEARDNCGKPVRPTHLRLVQ